VQIQKGIPKLSTAQRAKGLVILGMPLPKGFLPGVKTIAVKKFKTILL